MYYFIYIRYYSIYLYLLKNLIGFVSKLHSHFLPNIKRKEFTCPEEKEEYDFQRVKMYIQNMIEEKGKKYINLIENVPFIRKDEIKKCSEKLNLSKNKIEKFLNLVIKNTR